MKATKLIPFNINLYLKGAEIVTSDGVKVISFDVSLNSNFKYEGRIASDPKLLIYWDENGKAHGTNRVFDLKHIIERELW